MVVELMVTSKFSYKLIVKNLVFAYAASLELLGTVWTVSFLQEQLFDAMVVKLMATIKLAYNLIV